MNFYRTAKGILPEGIREEDDEYYSRLTPHAETGITPDDDKDDDDITDIRKVVAYLSECIGFPSPKKLNEELKDEGDLPETRGGYRNGGFGRSG